MIDASYTGDAVAWLIAWAALGLTGRQLLARADQRRDDRKRRQHREGTSR